MSTNGQLVFTDVDKITFKGVGNTSNAVVDTVTGKIGVGIDSPDANLHVLGNSYVSTNLELGGTLIMGTVNVEAYHSLEAVTAEGNTTPLTIEFQNTDTSLVTSGNVVVNGNVLFTSNVTTSVDSNVVVEHKGPHGRDPKAVPLKKYPEIAFAEGKFDANESTNTYVQAGYTVTASNQTNDDKNAAKLYKDNFPVTGQNETWQTLNNTYDSNGDATSDYALGGRNGSYTTLELPHKIKLSYLLIQTRNSDDFSNPIHPKQIYLYGSNDGSSWTQVGSHLFTNAPTSAIWQKIDINSTTLYNYFALQVTSVLNNENRTSICQLRYYGYEEDPPAGDTSVDTAFKSVLNTPQTTGVNVYVDAKLSTDFTNQVTGPIPTGTAMTYDSIGKYWELTGELTSNISVEANTFLEGDQPHAVSVWFNSSNLEANVSNTCVFSIASEEKLDSVNLDLQSNTWHNLTYSYQGEGGSKVTYLDGRKVSEDQAEDTFGDYPPFAMTGYSQGGYVVSASSENNTTDWLAYNAFSDGVNHWYSADPNGGNAPNYYDGGNGVYTGPANLGTDTGGYTTIPGGEWIRLEMPHKLKLSYVNLECPNNRNEFPGEFYVYGSNDDKHWNQLYLAAFPQFVDAGGSVNHSVNAMNAYKYLAIVATRSHVDSGASYVRIGYVGIGEIKFYGHRENDLVRLPDPTNVLKYPHLNFTNHGTASTNGYHATALRGYVVSASTKYSSGSNTDAWRAFDGVVDLTSGSGGQSWDSATNTYASSGTGRASTGTTTFNSRNGEWINIKFPHKVLLTSYQHWTRMDRDHEGPYSGYLYGSNDGFSTFQEIHRFAAITLPTTSGGVKYLHTVSSSYTPSGGSAVTLIPYNEYRLQVTHTQGSPYLNIALLEFYGTGVDSIPIQIGGGNIDKVANFRVYDKFIGEDQALEIWDAQKDEFGRAKSSMTLHKGYLGLGTEEPEGRLAVADEPDPGAYGLQEFPPRAMGGDETLIEGHGIFKATSSTIYNSNYKPYHAFDKTYAPDTTIGQWVSQSNSYDNASPNSSPVTSGDRSVLFNGTYGSWIQLEMPYKIILKRMETFIRMDRDFEHATSGILYGSNDGGSTYDKVFTFDDVEVPSSFTIPKVHHVNLSKSYSTFAFQITKLYGQRTFTVLGELKFFGYREQVTKQSVLHDGQLTLTKNLTVPRIGPALDADDTPRRDRLVVEYNTSTNPTFEGAVRDTSGRGLDGVFYGSASYDATEKMITLSDGTDDYVESGKTILARGTPQHSFSFWVEPSSGDHDDTGTHYLMVWGSETAQNKWSAVALSNDGALTHVYHSSGKRTVDKVLPTVGNWYHVAVVVNSTIATTAADRDIDIYVDGDLYTGTYGTFGSNNGSTSYYLNWGSGTYTSVRLGSLHNASEDSSSSLSTIKLYDCALTAQEVKTLYDMGRCDEGHHVVNFSKTRVGIGLGDGEAPMYTLDVRGQIRSQGSLVTSFTGQHRCFPDEPVEKGLIVSTKKNQYVKLNGLATGKGAITIDESLPIVSLSSVAQDKACFGVVSSTEEANTVYRVETTNGGVISYIPKTLGDNRAIVNSVGEGAIWVVNTGGPMESGDYITTSNVVGYGQKQTDDVLHNYTVAKITMDCDFNPVIQPVLRIKKGDDGMNILDEHEQLQWEDHPTETEKAYKIRYLDADGTQTDEANAVHIAAFVGCTYHCG